MFSIKNISKRGVSLIAIAVGCSLFAGAVFADLMIGSGYQQLKDSIRNTSGQLAAMTNFTLKAGIEIALDGTRWAATNMERVQDLESGLSYTRNSDFYANYDEQLGFSSYNSYRNSVSHRISDYNSGEMLQWYEDSDNSVSDIVYYKMSQAFAAQVNYSTVDPLADPMSHDLEKVLDALVGGLANLVQVSPRGEGLEFTGSLNENQVPLVVQAVISYAMKEASGAYDNQYRSSSNTMPFQSGASVSAVNGWAVSDAENRLTEMTFDFTILGTDQEGQTHTMAVKIHASLSEIGSTQVQWPNLENMTVEERVSGHSTAAANPEQAMQNRESGSYKSDIVLDTGDSYRKIGERYLELEVSATTVRGRYREELYEGYQEYAITDESIEFEVENGTTEQVVTYSNSSVFGLATSYATSSSMSADGNFMVYDSQGREYHGYLDLWGSAGNMYFELNPGDGIASSENIYRQALMRVFE